MVKSKKIRQKGKLRLSEYYKKLDEGDTVAIVIEKSVRINFPKRMQGKTGKVIGSRGYYKLVELKDKDAVKTLIIHPIHLRKL